MKSASCLNGTVSKVVAQNASIYLSFESRSIKLKFLGHTLISDLLELSKEPLSLSWWIHIQSDQICHNRYHYQEPPPENFSYHKERRILTLLFIIEQRLILVSKCGCAIAKRLHSRYAAASSKPKTDASKIYLDACYLPPPWNAEAPETQRNHWPDCYSKLFRRHQKRFKVKPTSEFMDQTLSPGGVG
ncbi:hypothetical protein ACTXT7_015786 [Hymenolepis weldensis]